MNWDIPLLLVLLAAAMAFVGHLWRELRRGRRARAAAAAARRLPVLVHSINADRCVGCEACTAVCPTRVLELVDHKVTVARFADCIQCRQCESACPTRALVMHGEHVAAPPLLVPELDDCYQTTRPGFYLIGEIAGKPLVKNAANLGRAVVEHIRTSGLRPSRAAGDLVDVLIVGSGPAGLSAALSCVQLGYSYALLEKDREIATTISRYPAGKQVMAEPPEVENLSLLPIFDGAKEALLAAWKRAIADAGVRVRHGEVVEGIESDERGHFVVKTGAGIQRARRVVLAAGIRGTPRTLDVPGHQLAKVRYGLDEARAYTDRDVLVVGGGDSALEAACALAEAGARVVLSYRSKLFSRAKPQNRERVKALGARLRVLLGSNVVRFGADDVTLTLADGTRETLPNQAALVLIGADAPVAWLERLGIRHVERPHRYALGPTDALVRRVAPGSIAAHDLDDEPTLVAPRPAVAA